MQPKLKLYQIAYNDQTAGYVKPPAILYMNADHGDMYFENTVIRRLINRKAQSGCQFFGVLSWQFELKCFIKVADIENLIDDSTDVYSFFASMPAKNMWVQAEIWHKGITELAQEILKEIGFNHDLLSLETRNIYQNHFITRPAIYELYVKEMLFPALAVMETEKFHDRLMVDSGYKYTELKSNPELRQQIEKVCGVPYFPLHTFICERLFATWLAVNPQYSFKHIA